MSILATGFLIGMRHALDADHLAAIAVLLADKPTVTLAARQGAVWGIGHSLTLLLVGVLVIGLDIQLSERLAHSFELAVGLMLIVLGIDLLRRLRSDQADAAETPLTPARPARPAPRLRRALGIGLMHGLAGSSALILLTLSSISSQALAYSYIGLFGLGSIAGMALLSVALALPLGFAGRQYVQAIDIARIVAAIVSIILGTLFLINSLSAL